MPPVGGYCLGPCIQQGGLGSLPLCPVPNGPSTHHTPVSLATHLQEDAACTFAPDTAASQPLLAVAAHPHGQETYLERVERLAFKDKQRQDACRSATADHYYAQFSFKPQINERSRRIARVRDQWRLLWVRGQGHGRPACQWQLRAAVHVLKGSDTARVYLGQVIQEESVGHSSGCSVPPSPLPLSRGCGQHSQKRSSSCILASLRTVHAITLP